MADGKKIQIIHAADADQHLGHLKKILDTFKEEDRIESYSTIPSDAVAQDAFNTIGKEDMLIMLLTNDILDKKPSIEAMMLDVKKRQPEARCAGVIIDNITYDPSFIAFPSSLEPVRTSEDMDAVWQGIAENLKKLFPKLVVPIVPPPPPPNDDIDTKTKPWWKKWLPYIFGIVALLAIFLMLQKCFDKTDDGPITPPPPATEIIAKASVVAPRSVQGNCPHKFNFKGTIKVSAPMTVKYTWIRSDNASAPVQSITFNAAGEKQVNTSWTLGTSYSGYQQLKIVSPKELLSNKAAFRLQCTPVLPPPVTAIDMRFTNTNLNGFIASNAFASQGIKRIFSNSNGLGYCPSTFPVIKGSGSSKYLSMAKQGNLNSCNTVYQNFEFERPMKRVTIYFIGAVVDYKLQAFSASGSALGVVGKQGSLNSVRSVTYTSTSANISRVRFGYQAGLNKITRIRASQ